MESPVRKSLTVKWSCEQAFERFTSGIASWWPLATHSVGEERAQSVSIEGRVGGQIVEQISGGETSIWGTLTAWEPPRRLAFSWHPGKPSEFATSIEVSFEPVPGGTKLTLVHSNWEVLGAEAQGTRRGYSLGWAYVLRLWAGWRFSPIVLGLGFVQAVATPLLRRRLAAKRAREQARSPVA